MVRGYNDFSPERYAAIYQDSGARFIEVKVFPSLTLVLVINMVNFSLPCVIYCRFVRNALKDSEIADFGDV